MKKRLLFAVAAAVSLQAKAQSFTHAPVPVTGFTEDVIADGAGAVTSSSTVDMDGDGFNLVAQNYVSPGNQTPTSFLPTGGLINSLATPGLSFQLAPYNASNSLRLSTANGTGTLTFTTPRAAHRINLLVTSAYTGTFTATVNFSDGTNEAFTGNAVPNWYNGTIPVAIKTIGRVGRSNNVIENPADNPRLYQFTLNLNAANTAKNIQSITFTKTTTGAKEIVHIFAVSASTLIPNDIGLTAITAPTSPVGPGVSQPVMVTVKNYGSAPLTTATLGFSVDGTTVVNNFAYTATPPLATNAVSGPVTIGNFTFTPGTRKIKAWSSQPNGVTDGAKTNDTVQVTLTACNALNGAYTIDKTISASATNFTSFASLQTLLNNCGVSGPVTVTVAQNSGPYNEQLVLGAINGTSATNTLTFEGNGNTVSSAVGANFLGVFTLDGADYVKINNFNIELPAGATTGWGIQLKNNADNNIISNNTINLPINNTVSSVNGIVIGAGATTAGNNSANTLIQNNIITGGYHGIAINGNTGNVGAVNIQVKNNQIRDPYLYGLNLSNITNNTIEGNDISRVNRTNGGTFYGVNLTGTSIGNQIRKNRIHNTHDFATAKNGNVYAFYSTSAGAVGSENVFANNVIYNLNNAAGGAYGFYNATAPNTWYIHNTMVADDPAFSYNTLRGFWLAGATTNMKVINNNLSLVSPATSKHLIYLSSTSIALVCNNNNLYKGTTGNIGFFSVDKVNMSDWKATNSSAYDQNSVSVEPYFVNVATGNLQPNAGGLNNIGQANTTVTDDITGAARSATTPDPGAYEFVPAAGEVGISAVLSPNSGCGLTNQETVSVTLNNYGTAAQSNIPVSYTINGGTPVTETYAGPLASGASVTYNFNTKANLSVAGNYTIEAKTNLVGDPVSGNNASTKVLDAIPLVATYPYVENFETTNGGWLASGVSSSWAWGTPAKATINSAASGTKAYVTSLTGTYNLVEKSQVVSPCFNFSNLVAPIFEMKVWWSSDFSNDGAVLQSSIDNGATWQNVGAMGDPDNWYNDNSINGGPGNQLGSAAHGWSGRAATSNGPAGWVTAKHALTGLGGKSNVKLRVAFGADASTNYDGFAFDDVMIYETPSTDGGVTAIISPNSGCGLSNQETVTITVKNHGGTILNNVPVSYKVDGGAAVNEVITGPIAANASVNHTFAAKANLSANGAHRIVARTMIAGDNIAANDSIVKIVNTIPVISTLPYMEGFENGNGGWLAGGVASSWALGTPAKTIINSAGGGTKSWVTNLTGNYFNGEQSYVVGPCFNFSGMSDPDFEMKVWWNSEFSVDGAVLQSSVDGGATWQVVGAKNDPFNWYNDNAINAGPGGQPAASAHGWTGRNSSSNGSAGWKNVRHRLTGLGGQSSVLLRIAFGSDGTTNDEGFAFDDVRILDNTNNLAVTSIEPINKLCGLSNAEPITALIQNVSYAPISGFTVSYTVDGGTPVTEPYPGTLAAGATANFTFSQKANLSASGSHTIVATVNLAADPDPSNNSATYTVANSSYAGLPPVIDFEPTGTGLAQISKVTKAKSAVVESAAASFGPNSTQGLIMDGVSTGWVMPTGVADPWSMNPDNFAGVYFCFDPTTAPAAPQLWLNFDLKQLFKLANANTNFRVMVNGTQVGTTYRPPFSGAPITWQRINVDLTNYKNLGMLQIGLESSVKEPFANGIGTANLIDNISVSNSPLVGVKENLLTSQLHIFPNPSQGSFMVDLPTGKAYDMEVTDLAGRSISKMVGQGTVKLKLDGAAKGVYLLKVSGENGTAVRKLIVE